MSGKTFTTYRGLDDRTMVEIAEHHAVNLVSARSLGMVPPGAKLIDRDGQLGTERQ